MRIGFDAKRAAQNATGLGNYSRFIIRSLQLLHPEHEYLLYTPKPAKAKFLPDQVLYTPQGKWKKLPSLWRTWGITNDLIKDRVELFHGLSNELPLNISKTRNIRTIVTIHDLIFRRLPYCYKPIDRWIYNYKFRKACEQADRIIAVSQCTKRDIVDLYGIPEQKISVVYQGCDPVFRQRVSDEKRMEVINKYNLPEHFILYVGSIERRKNLLLLAEALQYLDNKYQVIAVGRKTPYVEEINRFLTNAGLTQRLRMIHGVPFSDLPAFYQLADTFVYPSRYEGFGIPLLEALCSGTPVIGATGSCLEEAGGADSLYVHPDDAHGLADAIRRINENETLRETMIENGYKYALQFEEDRLTAKLWEVYSQILNL